MTTAQRAKLKRLAKARPRYVSGPKKGKFKKVGRNPELSPKERWKKHLKRLAARKRAEHTKASMKLSTAAAPKPRKPRKRKHTKKTAAKPRKRTGGMTMAKKKKPAKKARKHARKAAPRKHARKAAKPRKHGKMTKAARSRASKKGWARRRRAGTAHKKAKRRGGRIFTARYSPSTRKTRSYQVHRKLAHTKSHGKSHPRYKYYVKHNDMKSMLMQGLGLFGGFYGMKIINNLLKIHVTSKIPGLPVSVAPVIPAVGGFVLALLAPKLIKNKPALVGAIQAGATIALLDTIVKAFVIPNLPASVTPYLQGIDDVGYGRFGGFGYPSLGEYIPQQPGSLSDYGVEAHEAMALDEYVQERSGMGYDVNEALADSEVQGFQSGYAAGSLAKTVFSV